MRNFLYATIIVFILSCAFNGNGSIKSAHEVQISDITENEHYPAKIEEWNIGEVEVMDVPGKTRAVTGITENGDRCKTFFPMVGIR
jgi:hypothetical protein